MDSDKNQFFPTSPQTGVLLFLLGLTTKTDPTSEKMCYKKGFQADAL
jgi:hypothetical protein